MQRKKTKEEIAKQFYLSKTDIRVLLGIGYPQSIKVYNLANDIDNEELQKYRIEPTKVRMTSVCKVTGFTLNTIQKQVRKENTA